MALHLGSPGYRRLDPDFRHPGALQPETSWTPNGKTGPEAIGSHAFDTGAAWAHLALQATLSGWHVHGIGGFDRAALRAVLAIPEGDDLHAVVTIGRQGDKSVLPAGLQERSGPGLMPGP